MDWTEPYTKHEAFLTVGPCMPVLVTQWSQRYNLSYPCPLSPSLDWTRHIVGIQCSVNEKLSFAVFQIHKKCLVFLTCGQKKILLWWRFLYLHITFWLHGNSRPHMAKVHLIPATRNLLNYSVGSCTGHWGCKKSQSLPAKSLQSNGRT